MDPQGAGWAACATRLCACVLVWVAGGGREAVCVCVCVCVWVPCYQHWQHRFAEGIHFRLHFTVLHVLFVQRACYHTGGVHCTTPLPSSQTGRGGHVKGSRLTASKSTGRPGHHPAALAASGRHGVEARAEHGTQRPVPHTHELQASEAVEQQLGAVRGEGQETVVVCTQAQPKRQERED